MHRAASLSFALALALALACANNELPGEDPGAVCDTELSYESDVAPIVARYCVSCHSAQIPLTRRRGAPGDQNFDDEADVLERAERITRRAGAGPAAQNHSMPPRGFRAPSDDERLILATFLACHIESSGAPHHHH